MKNTSNELKNSILKKLAKRLLEEKEAILKENEKDLNNFDKNHPNYDRLMLTSDRIKNMSDDLIKVAALSSPLDITLSKKKLENGLTLKKITVPLGIIGIIYEARPNVTVDVFSLCFKAGNSCILKGGKEAFYSNIALVKIIHDVLFENNISKDVIKLLPNDKQAIYDLLHSDKVDVIIPRGGQSLINFVRDNAKVPVIETGAGIVHTYFDVSGDIEKGKNIITNAKTRRVSVCNALDTLLIHEARLRDLPSLLTEIAKKQVEILADAKSYSALLGTYPSSLLKKALEEDFGCEFLSYKMSIKTVSNLDCAIKHIMHYTSHHSEAIIAEDKDTVENFLSRIDAAVVYANASTAFTDGGQFGMGAEIGISTQKLHARGPMGLDALTSYKWVVYGDGHIRE